MPSKVFISWSGELSKNLGEAISKWLPYVLQFVKPFFTPDDVQKGARWSTDIASELEASNVGIICLTPDNLERPWILFEAGALSKSFGAANVCPILFNLDSTDLKGPLTSFQATKFEKRDFKKLVNTINNTGGDLKLQVQVLDDIFEVWWPKLETEIAGILEVRDVGNNIKQRTERDLLEEILELSRFTSKGFAGRSGFISQDLFILLKTLQAMQKTIISMNGIPATRRYFKEISSVVIDLSEELALPELKMHYEQLLVECYANELKLYSDKVEHEKTEKESF